eukprot:gene7024-6670_t
MAPRSKRPPAKSTTQDDLARERQQLKGAVTEANLRIAQLRTEQAHLYDKNQ